VRRREFITLVSGVILACPVVARAQQQPTMPVIGFLHYGSAKAYAHIVSAVRQGLRESGFIESQNVAVEYRWADGQYDRLPALAGELVQRQVLAIVAAGVVAAEAAKAATTTIPIVFSSGADPIAAGIVASLNRPGGNATGVSVIAQELALVPALGSADAGIPIDLDDLPAAALGDLPELADLDFDGLRISRDPDIECGSLWFGHDRPASV